MNRQTEYIELVRLPLAHLLVTSLAFAVDSFVGCCTHRLEDWASLLYAIQKKPVNIHSELLPRPKPMQQLFSISPMEVCVLCRGIQQTVALKRFSSFVCLVKPGDDPKPIPIPGTVSELYGSVTKLFSSKKGDWIQCDLLHFWSNINVHTLYNVLNCCWSEKKTRKKRRNYYSTFGMEKCFICRIRIDSTIPVYRPAPTSIVTNYAMFTETFIRQMAFANGL